MTESLFLDVSEAAGLLGVSDDLVYDLVARGELPAAEFGRRKKIPRRAIDVVVERALAGFDPDVVLARLTGAAGPGVDGHETAVDAGPTGSAGSETVASTPPDALVR